MTHWKNGRFFFSNHGTCEYALSVVAKNKKPYVNHFPGNKKTIFFLSQHKHFRCSLVLFLKKINGVKFTTDNPNEAVLFSKCGL